MKADHRARWLTLMLLARLEYEMSKNSRLWWLVVLLLAAVCYYFVPIVSEQVETLLQDSRARQAVEHSYLTH